MTDRTPSSLAIVGAGAVGATMAYAALLRGVARRVAIYDINAAKVRAEALDLAHGIQFMPMAEVVGSDDIEVCRGAEVIVVTAGAKQQPGQTRMELAASTVGLMKKIIPDLVAVAPNATFIMVTNPVDVVTYAALKLSGLPANRLFGSGTVLDSSRLRYLVAQATGVAVQNVHAYMAGEHGDTEIPLWSSASIGGVPLLEWEAQTGHLGGAERDQIAHRVVNAAYEIIEGKGATNYAIGLAGASLVEALLGDQRTILPVSSVLDDYRGISGVAMSVPSLITREGVSEVYEFPMDAHEIGLLKKSADAIKSTLKAIGF